MTRRKQAGRVVVTTAAGYLVGTFPSADLAARFATRGSIDLRAEGGNPGALNAAQQLGKQWGLAVLVSDAGKGAIAGVLGRAIGGPNGAYTAAGASIAGHIVPVWNGFRGGKGVATSAGACLAVFPVYFPLDASVAAAGAVGSRNAGDGGPALVRRVHRRFGRLVAASVVERMGPASDARTSGNGDCGFRDDPHQIRDRSPSRNGPMIAVVTDSNTMVPSALRSRFGLIVVPLTVAVLKEFEQLGPCCLTSSCIGR